MVIGLLIFTQQTFIKCSVCIVPSTRESEGIKDCQPPRSLLSGGKDRRSTCFLVVIGSSLMPFGFGFLVYHKTKWGLGTHTIAPPPLFKDGNMVAMLPFELIGKSGGRQPSAVD